MGIVFLVKPDDDQIHKNLKLIIKTNSQASFKILETKKREIGFYLLE